MNTNTGEMRDLAKLTPEDRASGDWMELTEDQAKKLATMNRAQRRAWAKAHGLKPPRKHDLSVGKRVETEPCGCLKGRCKGHAT